MPSRLTPEGHRVPHKSVTPAKITNPGSPRKGWKWQSCADQGEYPGPVLCEWCSRQHPRYLHEIAHPNAGTLHVGCKCAGELTEDYAHPKAIEGALKRQAAARRKEEFKARVDKLMVQWNGRSLRGLNKATVFQDADRFKLWLHLNGCPPKIEGKLYSTTEDAKRAACEMIVDHQLSRLL